ncbi:MAG: InlB B-repeat-containing protein [Muribaculaceae bacterium]|nr:InlB B-repeat-containing protein [Muribaculaceae bacterium]
MLNCEYDYENLLQNSVPLTSYSAYGVLANRTAVCNGYALAYKLLLQEVGIECCMVTSTAMNHAWNLIRLGGQYYQVDTTWDDPTWDLIGRVVHDYMFCSDGAFAKHSDWKVVKNGVEVGYTATDTSYDEAFWKDCHSPLVLLGDDCYYVSYSGQSLRRATLTDITGNGTQVKQIGQWYTMEGNGIWRGTYSGLFCIDNRLYYNDSTRIYSVALDGSDVREEFKANTANGYIYGSAYCQGRVLYSLHQTPNFDEKETVLTAVLAGGAGGTGTPDDPVPGGEALDLDNLKAEYTTTEDKKVSSSAEGKPKLLIFYSNNCGYSKNTIADIKKNIDQYAGLDVYAIETNKGTKESVLEFKKKYGCDAITFSYDTGTSNSASMWNYIYAAGLGNSGSITWPVICYIDANNRLQYVTTGYQASSAVLDYLEKYCGYVDGKAPVDLEKAAITLKNTVFTYSGEEQEPKAVVSAAGRILVEGEDYALSYQNNKNAGTAVVTVTGISPNYGSVTRDFTIRPASVTIRAKDKNILVGDAIPKEYAHTVSGLVAGDSLLTPPTLTCTVNDTTKAGRYDIIPAGADAGANYDIVYEKGTLTVASEYVTCTVTYDVQGRGTAPEKTIDIKVGSLLERPKDPEAAGCRFDGWYTDAACKKAWKFETDIVQADMTLYAKWLVESADSGFALQEISDVSYTGKACKPAVSVYDGEKLLKAGRDYQIKYYNNTNANPEGMSKRADGKGENFQEQLPYVQITGKGDYTEVVKVNFNILRMSIGNGGDTAAAGVKLKVNDQLTTSNKVQKPFSSIKYVKGMSRDVDFTLSLTAVNARDQYGAKLSEEETVLENAQIPAGYVGEFALTVQGKGNYEGSVCVPVHVADKNHLIKNAKITLGKNQKSVVLEGSEVRLTPSQENTPDTFTVKCGSEFLVCGKDYRVDYVNNDRVGKAQLIVTGQNEYAGSKTVTFTIKGRPFNAKKVTVEGLGNKVYTGKAITQNTVSLTYGKDTEDEEELLYGTDYTISYKKNINKGTATATFQGAAQAGYSGSFKKTFKITAQDIASVQRAEGMQAITAAYSRQGVKPAEQIVLTNSKGMTLQNGKDYTLKYANNKAVASPADEKPPVITVKGKGNYSGSFDVPFTIVRGDLKGESIQVKASPTAYQAKKTAEYAYKPGIKVMDGKSSLRAGTDYEILYVNNTQADYESYLKALEKPEEASQAAENMPRAVITEKEGSSYKLEGQIVVPLPIYREKLTKSKVQVEFTQNTYQYTGVQITPTVKVYYLGEEGKTPLKEGTDYSVSFGANVKSGNNKGSVKISGLAPYYGGDVTVKFNIARRPLL